MTWTTILAELQSVLSQPWAQQLEAEILAYLATQIKVGGMPPTTADLHAMIGSFRAIKGV